MRILVAIVHYFRPTDNPVYSSQRAGLRDRRAKALSDMVTAWTSLDGSFDALDVHTKQRIRFGNVHDIDIAVIKTGPHHVISRDVGDRPRVTIANALVDDPRMLPFTAHKLLANNAGRYDWYVFTEDDLMISDPDFITKMAAINAAVGHDVVVLPNRYELNRWQTPSQTLIDGFNQRQALVDRLWQFQPAFPPSLVAQTAIGTVALQRARNPHAGFFMITDRQLQHWMASPHFLDLDCSYISPLESAASLGLTKCFGVFKPAPANARWLAVQHLDSKFSSLDLPVVDAPAA
jgi:hypothetical protein